MRGRQMPVVTLKDIHKSFGTDVVFQGLRQRIYGTEKVGLIGPNGCGKTTLLKLILGSIEPDAGKVLRRSGLKIGYLPQQPGFTRQAGSANGQICHNANQDQRTVLDAMHSVFEPVLEIQKKMQKMAHRFGTLSGTGLEAGMREYDRLSRRFDVAGGYAYETKINTVLAGLGFEQKDQRMMLSSLSGGQLARLELAKVLLLEADLLLLDEPTNHLDLQATIWLEKFLKSCRAGVVIISHDRYMLDSIACKIIEIDSHKTAVWKGNYTDYLASQKTDALQKQRLYKQRSEMVEKTRDFVARNKDREGMRKTARGRKTRLKKLLAKNPDFLIKPKAAKTIKFTFSPTKSRSNLISRARGLSKSFGPLVLFDKLSLDVLAGQRLGITGPNGTGKSTLIKLIIGNIHPTTGTIKTADTVAIGYLDQHGSVLDPADTVLQSAAALRPDLNETALRLRLGAFLFTGDDVFKTVTTLSGGQRTRLALCRLVLAEPDVLVLDEPTNHLDIAGKESFEQALSNFDGTVIIVSHDRFLLDRVVDKLLVLGVDEFGNKETGRFEFVAGGRGTYSRYAELTENRVTSRQQAVAETDKKKSPKRARPASSGTRKTTPAELRRFNKLATKEIEQNIVDIEEQITILQEQFGAEHIYKDPALLTRLRENFEAKQAELELLYRAYEFRNG